MYRMGKYLMKFPLVKWKSITQNLDVFITMNQIGMGPYGKQLRLNEPEFHYVDGPC